HLAVRTGHSTGELNRNDARFVFARYSPDGRVLATIDSVLIAGPAETVVELWDAASRTVRARLPVPFPDKHSTHHVSFSPDGRVVATCSQGMDVILWDAVTGKEIRRLLNYQTVMKTAFSPDGRTLAAAHNAGTVLLWDVD